MCTQSLFLDLDFHYVVNPQNAFLTVISLLAFTMYNGWLSVTIGRLLQNKINSIFYTYINTRDIDTDAHTHPPRDDDSLNEETFPFNFFSPLSSHFDYACEFVQHQLYFALDFHSCWSHRRKYSKNKIIFSFIFILQCNLIRFFNVFICISFLLIFFRYFAVYSFVAFMMCL